jgi:ribonucleoside-diphosphate reductase alpha chain
MTIPQPRPKKVSGDVIRANTGCGALYITVTYKDGKMFEVFAHLGKAGGCAVAQSEAICRMVSICLRAGIEPRSIIKQLRDIRCPSRAVDNGIEHLSCADAIAKTMEGELNDLEAIASREELHEAQGQKAEVEQHEDQLEEQEHGQD